MADAANKGSLRPPAALPIRPFRALSAFFKLLADNGDTTQTYRILHSVSGEAYRRGFERFISTAEGRRVIETPIRIEEIFAEVGILRAYPLETVGRKLGDFLAEERLSADDLLKAAERAGFDFNERDENDAFRRYFVHFELSHDLWHVLTGYGRDPLGELCLLEFTRAQWPNAGLALMCNFGKLCLGESTSFAARNLSMREAYSLGMSAHALLEAPIETILAEPLERARRALCLATPARYIEAIDRASMRRLSGVLGDFDRSS